MIQQSQLPNGIRIITDTNDTCTTVKLGTWVSVGSRHETSDIAGISHVLEHMVFKGTPTRTAQQISQEIEDVGGAINAYTSQSHTAYHVRVLKDDINIGLEIIADMVLNATLSDDDLEKEKGVILQEIAMYNDQPADMVWTMFKDRAYANQPFGRPIIGYVDTVKDITSQKLIDYRSTQYTPNRIIISASGNLNHDSFVTECARLFSGSSGENNTQHQPVKYTGGDIRTDKAADQVNLILGCPCASRFDPDYYVCQLVATILGEGFSSRLYREIREKRGLVYSVSASAHASPDTGDFTIYAGTGEKEVAELMPVLCDELIHLSGSLTKEELDRAKSLTRASYLMAYENWASHAAWNARDLMDHNRPVPVDEVLKLYDAVMLDDANRVAAELFQDQITFAAIGPLKNLITYDDILGRLKNA